MLDKTCQARTGAFRLERLKYATATSLLSKITTFSIQILAIPVAVHSLGPEQFSVYAVLASSLAFLSMSDIGMGPALTVGIASAKAANQATKEAELLSSAFFPVLGLSALVLLAFVISALLFPVESILGFDSSVDSVRIRAALLMLLSMILVQSLMTLPEAAQGGHQELHIRNLWLTFGNVLSLVAILLIARYYPTYIGMLLAVKGPFVLLQIVNVTHFFSRNNYLVPRWRDYDPSSAKSLMLSGAAIMLVTLGSYLAHQFPIVIANRQLGASITASVAATFSAFLLLFGMISLFSNPLRPAFADSVARHDIRWVRRAYQRYLLYSMSVACFVGLCMAMWGTVALRIWIGGFLVFDRMFLLLMGAYFVLTTWEHVHFTTLIGLGTIRLPGIIFLIRAVLAASLVILFVKYWGIIGIPIALCVSVVLVTGPLYYIIARLQFSQLGRNFSSLNNIEAYDKA